LQSDLGSLPIFLKACEPGSDRSQVLVQPLGHCLFFFQVRQERRGYISVTAKLSKDEERLSCDFEILECKVGERVLEDFATCYRMPHRRHASGEGEGKILQRRTVSAELILQLVNACNLTLRLGDVLLKTASDFGIAFHASDLRTHDRQSLVLHGVCVLWACDDKGFVSCVGHELKAI
jgi:hypothetical protein